MKFTPEQFDKAFEEFQQFGPRRRIPIEERWREFFPDVGPSDISELKSECEAIEVFACSLAEQVRDKRINDRLAMQQLAKRFPLLSQDRLGHVWSQAMWFSLR